MTPSQPDAETIHASCVAIGEHAVLICGPSGSGKSDLALRLLDRGAKLVSDDYTVLRRTGDRLMASAPATIEGKIEIRGIGIIDWPGIQESPAVLCIRLDIDIERMPPDPLPHRTILGVSLPEIALDALHASAPIKAELAFHKAVDAMQKSIEGR